MFKTVKSKFLRFKQIFQDGWDQFVIDHPKYNTKYYAGEVSKMLKCGSPAGGFMTFKCMKCGKGEHKVNLSCKGHFCPHCGKRYARECMTKIANMLFRGISYRQVVLNMPEQFREPFSNHKNQSKLYTKYMAVSHACLLEVIREMYGSDEYKIACITFIHTHSRSGEYKPHLHIILGEGALHLPTGIWKSFRYIPMDALKLSWKKHLLIMMRKEFPDLKDMLDSVDKAQPKGFYAFPGKVSDVPTKNYTGLIRYLTKYLASPPIGISRILDYNNDQVKYYYRSHMTKQNEYEVIDTQTFIKRMVLNILPKGFQRMRYYGLQHNNELKKYFEIITKATGDLIDAVITYTERLSYAKFFQEIAGRNPLKCSFCGSIMELWQLYHPDKGIIYDLQDRLMNGRKI